jgi:hypothetical protein
MAMTTKKITIANNGVYTKRDPIKRRMDGIRLKASTSFSCSVLVLAKRAILFDDDPFS